jgi:Big-like domain-containing protein/lactonase family protein with 7-bladed beta-propeller
MQLKNRLGFPFQALAALVAVGTVISGGCNSAPAVPSKTLTAIQVTPANPSVATGANQQFAAKGTFSDGSTADLTSTAAWSSSDTTEASITSAGQATGIAIGRPQITASSGGISSSTRLIVVEGAGAAVPRFAYSANPSDNTISIYTVDAASGQLRDNGYAMAGTGPSAIATDPAGKFGYVVNNSDNNVSSFKIDPAAGGAHAHYGLTRCGRFEPELRWRGSVREFCLRDEWGIGERIRVCDR